MLVEPVVDAVVSELVVGPVVIELVFDPVVIELVVDPVLVELVVGPGQKLELAVVGPPPRPAGLPLLSSARVVVLLVGGR